jgi:Ran GTPase-activating protein (RanGAP) involved in mRNA processing and transport
MLCVSTIPRIFPVLLLSFLVSVLLGQLLERLALSFNYLGNECCLSLARCINKLPRLRHLLIASCGLTVQFFEHHRTALAESFQGLSSVFSSGS